jgi:hypothetical protein
MARKVSISRWLVIVVMMLLAGIFIISSLNRRSSLILDSLLSHEFSKGLPEYNPMRMLNWTDTELLQAAAKVDTVPRSGRERIAFLFLARGNIPHEPIWQRFFKNHEEEYSIYVHANPGHFYPSGSLFAGREIPSQECPRFSRGIVDALRRLFAHALIDPRYNNAWFVNMCESSIPVRSFEFVHEYLMSSPVSFVESFYPVSRHHMVAPSALPVTSPALYDEELRKGELWMALRRDHVTLVVRDTEVYASFNAYCKVIPKLRKFCTWDEQYIQTLLALRDPQGIANRTVMYVDWTGPHGGSPKVLQPRVDVIENVQLRTYDTDGERHDTAFDNTTHACVWRSASPWPCFLFARKFAAAATLPFMAMEAEVLGY